MVWLNGKLVEDGELPAHNAGILLGWGVFTTVGIRAGKPRFLARHIARLERDAHEAQVPFDLDFAAISLGLQMVLQAKRIQNGLARLTLSARGDGRWSKEGGADFSILACEATPCHEPLRVQLSPYRVEAKRPLCGVKTTSYLNYLWAWRAAKARGFDEAILRDGRDFLSEGTRATLFWTRQSRLYTPSFSTGCLHGIGRELTLEWAQKNDLEVREGEFGVTKAQRAEEMWLVSAANGPRAVAYWHDENGVKPTQFDTNARLGTEFLRWFAAQNE